MLSKTSIVVPVPKAKPSVPYSTCIGLLEVRLKTASVRVISSNSITGAKHGGSGLSFSEEQEKISKTVKISRYKFFITYLFLILCQYIYINFILKFISIFNHSIFIFKTTNTKFAVC